ncbi:MAG: tetratricopeptide repeat-containing glycosyltransferase family protein, partial [Alphaproteobacteria bacterium]|nr:tetratricopeptide repeat-containing glycosyltransferase family protein [Alphaproteobacteria bacterium]
MSDGGEKDNGATGLEALADQTAEIPIPGPDEVDPLSVQGPGLDSPLVSPAMPMGGQRAPRPPTALDRAVALQRAGRLDEAIQAYDAMLRTDPGDARVWLNLGVALRARNRLEAAAACYRRAIALEPQNAGAHSNLGNVLRLLGRHQEATQCQHRALELDPGYHAAAYNMALVLHDVRLWREALRFFDRALAGGYDRPEVRLDRAATLLAAGDYAQGFAESEHRLRVPGAPQRLAPVWDGGPIDGKSILVRLEAGARDALMFLRYLPALAARGARVVVVAPAPMAGVVATIRGVAAVHVPGAEPPPAADLEVALNSLPHRFATTLETVPSSVPYLGVPAGREARQWAPPVPGARLKVGIVWADRAVDAQRDDRTCPFVRFLRLAGIPGVALYRLQTGPAAAERDRAGAGALVRDIAGEFRDLVDAAEAIGELDLVVGVDSSAMVLAGALGKTGFVVLPTTADWRWTDDPERTPWLPTFRLFRQRRPGDWEEVFARVAEALAAYAAAARPVAAGPAVVLPPPAAVAAPPAVPQAAPP